MSKPRPLPRFLSPNDKNGGGSTMERHQPRLQKDSDFLRIWFSIQYQCHCQEIFVIEILVHFGVVLYMVGRTRCGNSEWKMTCRHFHSTHQFYRATWLVADMIGHRTRWHQEQHLLTNNEMHNAINEVKVPEGVHSCDFSDTSESERRIKYNLPVHSYKLSLKNINLTRHSL